MGRFEQIGNNSFTFLTTRLFLWNFLCVREIPEDDPATQSQVQGHGKALIENEGDFHGKTVKAVICLQDEHMIREIIVPETPILSCRILVLNILQWLLVYTSGYCK